MLKEYDLEPLIEAVTGPGWSLEHVKVALEAIRETVLEKYGDDLPEPDVLKLLGRLLERKLIFTSFEVSHNRLVTEGWRGNARKAKYCRVPTSERRDIRRD